MILRHTLAFRTLLEIAHQRPTLDENRCRYVLEFLSAAASVRTTLHRELSDLELTEVGLGVLVVLFTLQPGLSTHADLAMHTGVTRSAMTEVVDRLESRGYVRRQRDAHDRRLIYVQLTRAGHDAADTALTRFIEAAARISRYVDPQVGTTLVTACSQLSQGCL